mmetsp:Transcript_75259/g.196210  ORF Transcript_75259/g.196210 Transcript_75259/m.196210 type:complete len:231 (-) Transcript_75259:73-765(-)
MDALRVHVGQPQGEFHEPRRVFPVRVLHTAAHGRSSPLEVGRAVPRHNPAPGAFVVRRRRHGQREGLVRRPRVAPRPEDQGQLPQVLHRQLRGGPEPLLLHDGAPRDLGGEGRVPQVHGARHPGARRRGLPLHGAHRGPALGQDVRRLHADSLLPAARVRGAARRDRTRGGAAGAALHQDTRGSAVPAVREGRADVHLHRRRQVRASRGEQEAVCAGSRGGRPWSDQVQY